MNKWVFLSHQLNQSHFAYGNGRTISIERTNKISNGDSSNNTILNLPTHFGTHLDFPYHFDINGKKGEEYLPDYYISNKVEFIELKINPITNHLINVSDFSEYEFNPNTEILIIRTEWVIILNITSIGMQIQDLHRNWQIILNKECPIFVSLALILFR